MKKFILIKIILFLIVTSCQIKQIKKDKQADSQTIKKGFIEVVVDNIVKSPASIVNQEKQKRNKVNIYYEIYGSGKPVVMIHGWTPDHRLMKGCLEPIFEDLDGYQRIYFDLPGMGKTKGESWINNSDQMLNVVLSFIEQIIPEKSFLLAGESYGGYLARGIVNKKPQLVDGLLLICPMIIAETGERTLPARKTIVENKELQSTIPEEVVGMYNYISVVQNIETWERFRDEVLSGMQLADEGILNKIRKSAGYGFSFNVDILKKPYSNPTLILTGRQDAVVGYHDSYKIIENLPRASYIVLDIAGHNLQIEQEKLFGELVSDWLNRVDINLQN